MKKQSILDAKEINVLVDTIQSKVKSYSTVSGHVLKTVLQHMVIEGLANIEANRKK